MRVLRALARGVVSVTVGTVCASFWPVAAIFATLCRPSLPITSVVPLGIQRINIAVLKSVLVVRIAAYAFRLLAPAQSRTLLLWRRFMPVYLGYMWTDTRNALRSPEARARAWAYRHEWGGIRVYSMVLELSGYYVKASQVLASKTEFMPQQWTKRLSRLFDDMPPQPWDSVRQSIAWQLQFCPLTTGQQPLHHPTTHHHATPTCEPLQQPSNGKSTDKDSRKVLCNRTNLSVPSGTHPSATEWHHIPGLEDTLQRAKAAARRRVPGTAKSKASRELCPAGPRLHPVKLSSPSPDRSNCVPAGSPLASSPRSLALSGAASLPPTAAAASEPHHPDTPSSPPAKPYRPPLPAPRPKAHKPNLKQLHHQQRQQNGTSFTNGHRALLTEGDGRVGRGEGLELGTALCPQQCARLHVEVIADSTGRSSSDRGSNSSSTQGVAGAPESQSAGGASSNSQDGPCTALSITSCISDGDGCMHGCADRDHSCAQSSSSHSSSGGAATGLKGAPQQRQDGRGWSWLQRRQRVGVRGGPLPGLTEEYFEWVQPESLAAASIAQVHLARLSQRVLEAVEPYWQDHAEVVVKVQHRHMERLMAADLANVGRLAAFLKGVLPFDPVPVVQEIQTAIPREFDFLREAGLTTAIREGLEAAALVPGFVVVPRVLPQLCSPRLLVMERMEGLPFTTLLKQVAAGDTSLLPAAQEAVRKLVYAFGHMVLRDGLFHADPHPGNLLLQVSPPRCVLLDFGQCKALTAAQQLHLCRLVLALEAGDPLSIAMCMAALGLGFGPPKGQRHRRTDSPALAAVAEGGEVDGGVLGGQRMDLEAVAKVAYVMFDTRHMPEACISPFKDNPVLRRAPVKALPPFVWMLLRSVMLLRGLCHALHLDIPSAALWKPLAEATLAADPATLRTHASQASRFL